MEDLGFEPTQLPKGTGKGKQSKGKIANKAIAKKGKGAGKVCHFFSRGRCRNGNACRFKHRRDDQAMNNESTDVSPQGAGLQQSATKKFKPRMKPKRRAVRKGAGKGKWKGIVKKTIGKSIASTSSGALDPSDDYETFWEFQVREGDGERWQAFLESDNKAIHDAYELSQQNPQDGTGKLSIETNGFTYCIDFATMMQKNMSTGRCRRIRLARRLSSAVLQEKATVAQAKISHQKQEINNLKAKHQRDQSKIGNLQYDVRHANDQTKEVQDNLNWLRTELEQAQKDKDWFRWELEQAQRDKGDLELMQQNKIVELERAQQDTERLQKDLEQVRQERTQSTLKMLADINQERMEMQVMKQKLQAATVENLKLDRLLRVEREKTSALNAQVDRAELLQLNHQIESWRSSQQLHIQRLIPSPGLIATAQPAFVAACHAGPTSRCDVFSRARIVKVDKIHNMKLWKRYLSNKEEMKASHQEAGVSVSSLQPPLESPHDENLAKFFPWIALDPGEHLLFHGTTSENLQHIVATGFDVRMAGSGLYGEGTYFASRSCKSCQYGLGQSKKDGCLILARVNIGDPYYAPHAMQKIKKPPLRDSANLDKGFYDSVVANVGIPNGRASGVQEHREIVIFNNSQAYPELVIHFQI